MPWTHKQVAKYLKSKGRGKLHKYCQLCRKQFRDNTTGFESHLNGAAHKNRMKDFITRPQYYVDLWSQEMEEMFMDIVKTQYDGKRVSVERIYEQYTKILHHAHLHSTKWTDLNDFARSLNDRGICKVWETETGLMLLYETMDGLVPKLKQKSKKVSSKRRFMGDIEKQMNACKDSDTSVPNDSCDGNLATLTDTPITFDVKRERVPEHKSIYFGEKRRKIDYWMSPNIIVKIIGKSYKKGKYRNKKGRIESVNDDGTCQVLLTIENLLLKKVPGDALQTVIPKNGHKVMIVKGPSKGKLGKLVECLKSDFKALIQIDDNSLFFKYDEFSKYQQSI